jgi:hypothetical protein
MADKLHTSTGTVALPGRGRLRTASVVPATSASMRVPTEAITCASAGTRCRRCRAAHSANRSMAGRRPRGTQLIALNTAPAPRRAASVCRQRMAHHRRARHVHKVDAA